MLCGKFRDLIMKTTRSMQNLQNYENFEILYLGQK